MPASFKVNLSLVLWAASVLLGRAASPAAAGGGIDFDSDIRPILSDKCFACHGPDENARKAKLRLDLKEEALKPRKDESFVIVPGDPKGSSLIQRVFTSDPDDVMPPPSTRKQLTAAQKDLLQRWVAGGASWQTHWAFTKPVSPPVPKPNNPRWARNEIDHFVAARLDRERLRPTPEATKPGLIRRVSFDVTGLPPTVEEVDAFLADKSPDAYEKVVDRLLASPRYGENMARYWLDAARYADSHGYHIDAQRDLWAYREWVIKAFNRNEPFDQFTVEQLAGDLLPGSTTDQKIGSGYIRANMSTGEGGAIEAEYAAKYAFDRTETASTMWLGLTMTCARCHTHKYDPITQREYYSFLAFFNQLDEPIMDGNRPNPDPFIRLPSVEQTERLAWLSNNIAQAQAKTEAADPTLDPAQVKWARNWHAQLKSAWTPVVASEMKSAHGTELQVLEDGFVLGAGADPEQEIFAIVSQPAAGHLAGLRLDTRPHETLPGGGRARAKDGQFRLSEVEAELVVPDAAGKPGQPQPLKFVQAFAADAGGDNGPEKAIDGNADSAWTCVSKDAGVLSTLFVLKEAVAVPTNATLRIKLRCEADRERHVPGCFRVYLAQAEPLLTALCPPRANPWKVIGPFKTAGLQEGLAATFPPEQELDFGKRFPGVREEIGWNDRADLEDGRSHLFVNELHGTHGAYYFYRTLTVPAAARVGLSLRADDVFKLWVNGQLVLERSRAEVEPGVAVRGVVELAAGENRFLIKMVNHQGAKSFAFNLTPLDVDAPVREVAAALSVSADPGGSWKAKARDFYRRQSSESFRALHDDLGRWREEQAAIDTAIPTTMVAKESAQPRETHVLLRGEYDKPGDRVTASVPAILPALPAGAPTNRLGLARWLVDPAHPLTARVNVNRFWQQFFGVGLVKTTEDFGAQGERPSHPELLDWLATEFVRSGWNVKHLQRLMLTSATYRQSSRATPELLARDPENRLLARGPRFRVDGEVVRDTALFVSGLLVEKTGGPSVKPFEPAGLWEAVSFNNSQKYVPDQGEGAYRRSLYTYWKRQSPPPNMLLFDAPTREYCVVRRPRTNTPLQALALLNDPQFIEAARAFAQRVLTHGDPDTDSRLAYAFRLAAGRQPARAEIRILRETLEQERAGFRSDPAAANALLAVGAFQAGKGADPVELAAWTTVVSMILNLDETVTKG